MFFKVLIDRLAEEVSMDYVRVKSYNKNKNFHWNLKGSQYVDQSYENTDNFWR